MFSIGLIYLIINLDILLANEEYILGKCKFLDMSRQMNENMPYFGRRGKMDFKELVRGEIYVYDQYFKYLEQNEVKFVDHTGTHVDAPAHFVKGGDRIESIQLNQTAGEACVIDISKMEDTEYIVTVDDILSWEKNQMRTVDGCILLLNTGKGKHWGNEKKFLGTRTPREPTSMKFPGFGHESSAYLVKNRIIKAVGTDAISFDSTDFNDAANETYPAHHNFLTAGILGYENLANVDKLPASGSSIILSPISITGASGAPVRAFAVGWNGDSDPCRIGNGSIVISVNVIFIVCFLFLRHILRLD